MAEVLATDVFMEETPNLPAVIGPPSAAEWASIEAQAEALSRSNLVPSALRGKAADILVIALTGRELQIPPMMAMSKVHVIEGKPTLSAELMIALVLRAGHEIRAVEQTDQRAVVACQRRGSKHEQEFSFTIGDAQTAKLTGKDVWQKYPRAMLWARAVSAACRAVFPDVLMGVSYVPEELGAEVDPYTGEVAPPVEETITEPEARAYLARIDDLDDAFKTALRERLVEIGMVIAGRRDGVVTPRLPKRRQREFETELEGVEQWNTKKPPAADDDEVAEGEIVDDQRIANEQLADLLIEQAEITDTGEAGLTPEDASTSKPAPEVDDEEPVGGNSSDADAFSSVSVKPGEREIVARQLLAEAKAR